MPVNYSTLNLKGLLPIATRKPVSKNDEEDADIITTTQESNAGEDFIVSFCLRHIELAEMVWLSQFFFYGCNSNTSCLILCYKPFESGKVCMNVTLDHVGFVVMY